MTAAANAVTPATAFDTFAAHETRARRTSTAASLVAPATLFVTICLLVPIAILVRYSLNMFDPMKLMVEAVSIENYRLFFTDAYYTAAFWRTLRLSAIVTVATLILALPLAYTLARTRSRFKNVLVMLIVLPLFVGNSVRAAGWMAAFGNRGLFNALLQMLGITSAPIELMYTEFAVVVGITAVNLPYVVLTIQSVLEGIDRSLEEAAFSLGATPSTMVRRVLLPLAIPGIAAGAIFCFILTMNAYATPVLLGGPSFVTMGPLVYIQFAVKNNWPFGAAVACILMATTLVLTAVANLMVQRAYQRGRR